MPIQVSASYPFRSAAVRVLMVSGFLGCAALLWGGGDRDYPVVPVSFVDVALTDGFWAPRQETNRLVTIPFMFETYARLGQTPWSPFLEGAASTLAGHPDPALRKRIAAALAEIAEGLIKQTPELKWKHLLNGDLISAGHFFEAAIAFWQATGDRTFLDAASRIADDIDSVFGPGRRRDVSNHEEVKVGLVRLFRATGNSRPLDLARFFLDERGRAGGRDLFGEYAQDHKPVVDQREAVGHGVRAAYLYMALTDIAALTGESKGRRLGIYEPSERGEVAPPARSRAAGEIRIELLGRAVPARETGTGIRAVEQDKPIDSAGVERYLAAKFGTALQPVRSAMEELARALGLEELAVRAFSLYERFRPSVPEGVRGWGAKGELDLSLIRKLAEKS